MSLKGYVLVCVMYTYNRKCIINVNIQFWLLNHISIQNIIKCKSLFIGIILTQIQNTRNIIDICLNYIHIYTIHHTLFLYNHTNISDNI